MQSITKLDNKSIISIDGTTTFRVVDTNLLVDQKGKFKVPAGTVTVNGEVFTAGAVQPEKLFSFGTIDEQGDFKVEFSETAAKQIQETGTLKGGEQIYNENTLGSWVLVDATTGKQMNNTIHQRRATRIRKKLKKINQERFRLTVFRSSRNISAQIVDDKNNKTLISATSVKKKENNKTPNELVKEGWEYFNDYPKSGEFSYNGICQLTLSKNFGQLDHEAVGSETGWGDGYYPVYAYVKESIVLGLAIDFDLFGLVNKLSSSNISAFIPYSFFSHSISSQT